MRIQLKSQLKVQLKVRVKVRLKVRLKARLKVQLKLQPRRLKKKKCLTIHHEKISEIRLPTENRKIRVRDPYAEGQSFSIMTDIMETNGKGSRATTITAQVTVATAGPYKNSTEGLTTSITVALVLKD